MKLTTEEAAIFPRTFGTVSIIVGAIWVIQGLGFADTGSFMDRQPAWAVAGVILILIGLISTLAHRRKRKGDKPVQPGS